MKKIILIIIILLTSTSTIFSLKPNKKPENNEKPPIDNTTANTNNPTSTEPTPEAPTPNESSDDPVTNILNSMTLDEKIGQMFIVSYRYSSIDNTFKNTLTTIKPGGFILFKENFQSYNQALSLINSIKATSKVPMFMAIDQEGGRVQRIKDLPGVSITTIPPMAKIGETENTDTAYNTGTTIATDLKKFGINMDFAPVLDVYSNPANTVIGDRSFGSDPYLVSKMCLALGKGLKDNNIIPVYKHFPGHGNTETDSHLDLPVVTKTKEELMNLDLIPFIDAINNNADVIMIGHLAVPTITNSNKPASLSKELITEFLKNELGYQNIVITDALNMKALTKNYTNDQIAVEAINAGVDILLMPENPLNAFIAIKNAINNGTITEEQINNSVRKIIALKIKYNIIK